MQDKSPAQKHQLQVAFRAYLQRHPREGVSSAELSMAEAVGLSQASVQKWRAGYPIAKEYRDIVADWGVKEAHMDEAWRRAFLRACGESPRPQAGIRADEPTDDLFEICQAANQRLWGTQQIDEARHYLARLALTRLLDDFLGSDQPGLILCGVSGIGKTSLAVWLASRQKLRRPVLSCPASLLDGTTSLPAIVQELLAPYLPNGLSNNEVQDAHILLVLDGVNESPEMVRLFWQVNRGLLSANYLKVLITIRPESFRIVRRCVALSRHLYFCPEKTITDGVLRSEPPALHIGPFTETETASAYERYRKWFGLPTALSGLPRDIQVSIRYPLTMRLLAEAYSEQPSPNHVTAEELLHKFLARLCERGRVYQEDLAILEDRVLPAMLVPDAWSDSISVRDLLSTAGDRTTEPQQPTVQPALTRLVDAGLLVILAGDPDEWVRFAHDSYFEYFVCRALSHLRRSMPDPADFYAMFRSAPWFLYEPLRRLASEELTTKVNQQTWRSLTQLPDAVLGASLKDYCHRYPTATNAWLNNLWHWSRPRPWWKRLFRHEGELGLAQLQNAQSSLVTAAIGSSQTDLLTAMLPSVVPHAQPSALVDAHQMWQEDIESAQQLVVGLGSRMVNRWGIPDPNVAAIFLQFCLLSAFDYGHRPEVVSSLRRGIRQVTQRVLRGPHRSVLLALTARWGARWVRHSVEVVNLSGDLEKEIRLAPEQQSILCSLAPYMDWETTGVDTDDAYRLMRRSLEMGSLLADWMVLISVVEQGLRNPRQWIRLVQRLTADAIAARTTSGWATSACYGICHVANMTQLEDDTTWKHLDEWVAWVVDSYPTWHRSYQAGRMGLPKGLLGPAHGLAPYLWSRANARLPVKSGPVWEVLEHKLVRRERIFLVDFLREVAILGVDAGRPQAAMQLLEPIVDIRDPDVLGELVAVLTRLRAVSGEDVNVFLERAGRPHLAEQVLTHTIESATYDWLYCRLPAWGFPFVSQSRGTRDRLVEICRTLPYPSSTKGWIERILSGVLSGLSDGE